MFLLFQGIINSNFTDTSNINNSSNQHKSDFFNSVFALNLLKKDGYTCSTGGHYIRMFQAKRWRILTTVNSESSWQ